MQIGNLAFFQNFYTDVTLLMPSESAAAAAAPAEVVAVVAVAATVAAAPATTAPALPLLEAAAVAAVALAPPVAAAAAAPHPAIAVSVAGPPLPSLPPRPLVAPARLPEAALTVAPPPAGEPVLAPPVAVAAVPPVPLVPPAAAVPPAALTPFATLGTNAQGVVLLVRLPPDQFAKLPRNVFLNKMLQALGLVMADVVLVNVESHLPVALASLRHELAATQIVAFGRNLLDVTVRNTQIYAPVQFPQLGFAYLAAAEIEMVEYDVSLKKRLWPGLQSMFLAK